MKGVNSYDEIALKIYSKNDGLTFGYTQISQRLSKKGELFHKVLGTLENMGVYEIYIVGSALYKKNPNDIDLIVSVENTDAAIRLIKGIREIYKEHIIRDKDRIYFLPQEEHRIIISEFKNVPIDINIATKEKLEDILS